MPVRVVELFQETLQGGSDMSLRAAGMQYRSTEEEKTKDKALTLKTSAFAHYWSAFVYVDFSVINISFSSVVFEWYEMNCLSAVQRIICPRADAYQQSNVNEFHKHVHTHVVWCKSSIQILIYLFYSTGEESCCPSYAEQQMQKATFIIK